MKKRIKQYPLRNFENQIKNNNQISSPAQSIPSIVPTLAPQPTTELIPTIKKEVESQKNNENDMDLEKLYSQMRNPGWTNTALVNTEDGSIQAIKQDDDTWVVIKIVDNWPPVMADFGVKLLSLNFIRDIYHSEFPIKQAGINVRAPKHIGKYYRAFLGANQAKTINEELWKTFSTSTFHNYLIDISTGREEDKANSTFVETNI